jgi:hypothetical protein
MVKREWREETVVLLPEVEAACREDEVVVAVGGEKWEEESG